MIHVSSIFPSYGSVIVTSWLPRSLAYVHHTTKGKHVEYDVQENLGARPRKQHIPFHSFPLAGTQLYTAVNCKGS